MSIAKLNLLEIDFPISESTKVLQKLIHLDNFHPEDASKMVGSVQGLSAYNQENPYIEIQTILEEANEKYQLNFHEVDIDASTYNYMLKQQQILEYLDKVKDIRSYQKELEEMIVENKATYEQLNHLQNSDLDFDELTSCTYIKVRVGKIPTEYLDRLSYYESQPFLFKILEQETKYTYCMYITTTSKLPVVDNIFSALFFENIEIPSYVHGSVSKAMSTLEEEIDSGKRYVQVLEERKLKVFKDNFEEINMFYNAIVELKETYAAQQYIVNFGDSAAIYGFAEINDAKEIKTILERYDDVKVEIKPANSDPRLTPPTKLISNIFTRPFQMFVEMYGVPGYTDFDPTVFVALSYTILFGVMYGDVGQGALLILVGLLAYKLKGMKLGAIGIRLGFASMLMGFVFGSVFGDEEILHPFFAPMESSNTMSLLGAAIGIGVVLTLISMIVNITIRAKRKEKAEMLFGSNGISGFVFYLSILVSVIKMLLGLNIPFIGTLPFVLIFTIIPAILLFLKEGFENVFEGEKMFPNGFGGYIAESFFELFDVCLTFLSNTMSFLRVGGFVLSHAGMMLVVYTLANMVGNGSVTVGSILVLVIGNIFVMVLEGLIVGIQVLRLEFYEMFSRYYQGNGRPFVSIKERLDV